MAAADDVPAGVWLAAGVRPAEVAGVAAEPLREGTGAASGPISLITARLQDGRTRRVVRKVLRPLQHGRHRDAARSPDHWAHWRRELLAYRSGLLPSGPGLRAPRLLGSARSTLYLEYVEAPVTDTRRAAYELGRWHHRADLPDEPWLARHQLAQRLVVTELDWSHVDVDPRLPEIWRRRTDYLNRLAGIPSGVTHGDFGTGNLRSAGADVVVLDWATFGISPVGHDLAHLTLATLDDGLVSTYLEGLQGRYDRKALELGYRSAVALIGTSRLHWLASRGLTAPAGYVEFVCAHIPK